MSQQMLETVLWLGAAIVLLLYLARRRKRRASRTAR
jgi:LPXTG-motif cell wall-anchored protein